jgi:hypothetical protein
MYKRMSNRPSVGVALALQTLAPAAQRLSCFQLALLIIREITLGQQSCGRMARYSICCREASPINQKRNLLLRKLLRRNYLARNLVGRASASATSDYHRRPYLKQVRRCQQLGHLLIVRSRWAQNATIAGRPTACKETY